jgi:hypothetical protein
MKHSKSIIIFLFLLSPILGISQVMPMSFFQKTNTSKGGALDFNGTPDYLTLPAGVYFNGDFTIECWVYPKEFSNWSRIIDFGNGASNNVVFLSYTFGTSGFPVFYVQGTQFQSNTALKLNQWNHVAATLSGTLATIYINGVSSGTFTFPTSPANVTRNNNFIGRSNWGTNADPDANAIFDDLRIWNVARTQAQIQANMNNELIGTETGLIVYFPFNEGVACGNNTNITSIADIASAGGASNATLNGFTLNNGCLSNFTEGVLGSKPNGLTAATAGSSAFQIKRDYPSSTDGLYWIKNVNINSNTPFQIYADMTTNGGGWTLIMCNASNSGWTTANAILRNTTSPSVNSNYSIISWADYIKKSASGFQYMLDAQSRGRYGGIWTANAAYSFVSRTNGSTDVTLNQKFDNWTDDNSGGSIQRRMPWYTTLTNEGIITTDDAGNGHWWGTLISIGGSWQPAPWLEVAGGVQNPGVIWYWVR